MSNSWWANKMGNPAPRPSTPPTQMPAQPAGYAPTTYPPKFMQPVSPEETAGHRLPASATSPERCPNCASGNYGRTTPESRARCYDCGYPITQSGTGMPGVRIPSSTNTVAATQISTANNFNPNVIVDRIG